MTLGINVCLTVRTQRTYGPHGPFHEVFGGTVTFGNQTNERVAVSLRLLRVHLKAWAGWLKGVCLSADGGLALVESTWSWIPWIVALAFHECGEWVLGQVLKHPKCLPSSCSVSNSAVVTLLLPTQNILEWVVHQPDLSPFHLSKWSVLPLVVPTHIFSMSCQNKHKKNLH